MPRKTRTLTFLVTITHNVPTDKDMWLYEPHSARQDLLARANEIAGYGYGQPGKAKVRRLSAGDVAALERRRTARKLTKAAPRVL